ncbi:MAG TPA: penicillin-binding protein 2 [Vicinamibacteria bacterium]|nr:penicillin-binding protein 2 [Vicinamibacteria bacterium]
MRLYEDLRGVQQRVSVLQSGTAGLLGLLLAAFWYLQVVRVGYYRMLAENNHKREVRIPASRGPIFDRNGRILVENRSSFNIVLSTEHAKDLDHSAFQVASLLGLGRELSRQRLTGPRFRSVVVKADASEADVAVIEARRLELPEASVDVVPLRSYPLGAAAAHVLGRVGEATEKQLESKAFEGVDPGSIVGQAGIEAHYNRLLMGRDGYRRAIVNSRGVEVREDSRQLPTDGPAATLTLDGRLQAAMEEAMAGLAGSAVALDPQTGEVLGMVSSPAYDPNLFSAGIDLGTWSSLVRDPKTPLINRVIQGQYPAGSTFKVVTALAALQEGVIGASTSFHCPGYLNVYGTLRRCHKADGHGTLDLARAIALSCNVYFYQVGVRLEIERISRYAKLLGLGGATGIDLPGEVSGLIPSPEWKLRVLKTPWFPGETVSVAIGQGQVLVTPMQMARLAAVVANGGYLVRPHLLRGEPTGEDRQGLDLKPATLETVRAAMLAVVREGTGRRAQLPGFEVAGKTGSSQVVAHERLERDKTAPELQPHGWFLCFAPADRPRIAMAVLVEHGRSGSESAAPVAGRILARYFGLANPSPPAAAPAIPPDGE